MACCAVCGLSLTDLTGDCLDLNGVQRSLKLTELDGIEIDLSPLASLAMLEEANFRGSSAVANIAPLAKIAT
jgi:hypothetical protein